MTLAISYFTLLDSVMHAMDVINEYAISKNMYSETDKSQNDNLSVHKSCLLTRYCLYNWLYQLYQGFDKLTW